MGSNSVGCTDQNAIILSPVICEGIAEYSAQSLIHIYPSPLKQCLFVESPDNASWESLAIFDVNGHKVYQPSKEQLSGETKLTLDLSSLASGIYVLKGNYRSQSVVFKIVKE